MNSNDQSPYNKSKAHSTVAPTVQPYRIPQELKSDKKNLKSLLEQSKVSAVENYFFKTKFHSDNDTQQSLQIRKCPIPKVENKLHLDLPEDQTVQVRKYVGEQKNFEQKVSSFFAKIFKSCMSPQTQQNFEQCDYCEHRYSKQEEDQKRREQKKMAEMMSQPYVSYRRLTERQKQPIQVFYQEITNQPIRNNRWESTQQGFKRF